MTEVKRFILARPLVVVRAKLEALGFAVKYANSSILEFQRPGLGGVLVLGDRPSLRVWLISQKGFAIILDRVAEDLEPLLSVLGYVTLFVLPKVSFLAPKQGRVLAQRMLSGWYARRLVGEAVPCQLREGSAKDFVLRKSPLFVVKYLIYPVGNRPYGGGGWSRHAKYRPRPEEVRVETRNLAFSSTGPVLVNGVRRQKLNIWDCYGNPLRLDYPDLKFS